MSVCLIGALNLLEIFDAARYAQPTTHARIAYPPIVRTKSSDMRLGSMQRRKEYDHERVECVEALSCRISL